MNHVADLMRFRTTRTGTRRWIVFAAMTAAIVSIPALRTSFVQAAPGVTAEYGFSEGVGTTTADSSGNALTGTLTSSPLWNAGHSGTGLKFNGTSTYVDLGNPVALQLTGSMTLSAWVYETANVGDDGQIIAKSDGSAGWQLKSTPDTGNRTFGIAIHNSSGGSVQRYSQTVRALNTWYHVTGVYNASTPSLDIYVNGVLNNGALDGTVPTSQRNGAINANIGRRAGGYYINGIVDDVRVHNRALTLAEIQSDMATAVGGGGGGGFDFTVTNAGNQSVVRGLSAVNPIAANLTVGTTSPVTFSASGLPAGTTASFSNSPCSPTCSTDLTLATTAATPLGPSTITVTGTSGALTRTTTFTLTVSGADATAPTVALTAPTDGAFLLGTTTVTATASDDVGVVGVQFLLDGANLGAEDTTSPYSVSWNTTTATAGPHTVSARARDASGKSTVSSVANVTVDNQAPTVASVVINGGAAATNNRNATLTLSASDALTGVTQMRFSNATTGFSTAENYATTKAWTLSTGTGTKTVYVQFRDGAGNWSASFTDTIVLDTTLPTVSAVASSNIGPSSATVTWTTNEAATSQVDYGTTTAYGQTTTLDPALVTAHSTALSGLASATTYNYRVRSKDAAGNERVGTNGTFLTLSGPDTTPPSVPTGLAVSIVSSTQVNVSWNASTDNVGVVGYDLYRDGNLLVSQSTRTYSDTTLTPLTSVAYTVRARDAVPNASAQSAAVGVTTPAFVITNVQVTNLTSSGATVTWTTDQPTDTQVEYGSSVAYGQASPHVTTLATSHSMALTGLAAGTLYHYRAVSIDSPGNVVRSSDGVFTTSGAPPAGGFLNEILLSNLSLATAVRFVPTTSDMLVLELGGKIWRVNTSTWTKNATPFLNLTNVGSLNGQQGLLDLAFDPAFSTNHYYYVFYTLGTPNKDRVSRFTADATYTGTVAGSEVVLYQDPQNADAEHHGGALNFGNDGKLYITTGEHFQGDPAQDLNSPRGKVLRINTDGTAPTDNPFYDGAGPRYDAIWALGLRNPFRATYDSLTGRLFVGDVGGNDWSVAKEELNTITRGGNYGWPNCEGLSCGSNPSYISPIYNYSHNNRDAAIVSGFVYRGSQFPAQYYGNFFFADYTQNWIKRLTLDASGNVTGVFNFEPSNGATDSATVGDIVHMIEGPDGALYYVDLGYSDINSDFGISKVRRIRFISSNQPPAVVASSAPTEGPAPLSVSFSTAGTSDPEGDALTYSWDFGDGGSSTAANPVHAYLTRGPFSARVTVSDGHTPTLSAPMLISVGNRPEPTILSPANGAFFRAGDVISFSGTATDLDEPIVPASAYSWAIDFLHDGHVHPALPTVGVTEGTFTIPASGHDFSGNTRYQFTLTITDADGLKSSRSVIIYPDKVNITLDSVPSGQALTLDGIPRATPFVYDTLVGFTHTINAPNSTVGSSIYTFASWSDGGAQQHAVLVPSSAQTYVATYTVTQNPVPPGLVAGFNFNEGAGTTVADSSGNNGTGVLVNSPVWTAAGKYASALTFNGTNYVDLGNTMALRLTGSMTVTSWIKISARPGDDGAIVSKIGGEGWQLKTSPDTGPHTAAIQITSSTGGGVQRYSSSTLALNTWYHLAGVYNATTRTLDIYVNGVLNNGVLSGTVPAAQKDEAVPALIGERPGAHGAFNFIGVIDESHVFNRALTPAEVVTDMNTPR